MTGAIPEDAAVFTLEAAPNGILLKCDEGYLTASMNENGLYYSETQDECSVWQFSEGVFLYNPNKVREYSGKTYNDYHMQYYNSYFTVYGKSSHAKPETYTMHFFKLGNSDPSESIVEDSYYTVPVFETSDVHGNLADTSGEKTKYTLSYISDKVKDARGYGDEEDRDRAILLDGGDIFQGNSMSYLLSGASMSAAYQMMGYDAVTIGNHEFDWGIESTIDSDCTLIDYALGGTQGENTVPVIVSNLLKDGERVSFSKDYIILEKKAYNLDGAYVNVRVGVIGFAGDYGGSIISDQFVKKGYSINEDFDSLNALAADLETNQGCNATILLAHEDASSIASSVGENSVIDLVLGGHTHRNSSGKTSWGLTYLEPSGNAKAYCTADMAFSVNDDNSVSFEGVQNPFVVSTAQVTDQMTKEDANVGELDPDLVDLTDQVIDELDDILYETVGYITRSAYRDEYLAGSGNRASTYGNWVTSINRRNCQADVAFVNSGGMRTDMVIEEGQDRRYVTVGDIYNMFPFGNYMYTYLLTYEDLLEALNYSLTSLGKGLLSCMTGVKCYYTDQTVNAIVAPDGTLAYHAGVWTDGWKDQLITVVVDEYIATTNRVSDNMSNPFVAWNETDRLVDTFNIDNQGALRVLREESAAHDGLLSFDDMPCYIVGDYRESARVTVAPEPKELVFSGESQELVTAGEATGGTMQYALGSATEATEPYTTSIPAKTNAGTYYVWYKAAGDESHDDSEPACVEAVIRQHVAPVYSSSLILGGKLSLNFRLGVPADLVAVGARAVMDVPQGLREVVLSSLRKDERGRYALSYPVAAIWSNKYYVQVGPYGVAYVGSRQTAAVGFGTYTMKLDALSYAYGALKDSKATSAAPDLSESL